MSVVCLHQGKCCTDQVGCEWIQNSSSLNAPYFVPKSVTGDFRPVTLNPTQGCCKYKLEENDHFGSPLLKKKKSIKEVNEINISKSQGAGMRAAHVSHRGVVSGPSVDIWQIKEQEICPGSKLINVLLPAQYKNKQQKATKVESHDPNF